MQAPSLYSYFASKAAILDALFVDGYESLNQHIDAVVTALPTKASPRVRLVRLFTAWVDFCQDNPARYRLLFTNAIPGWAPSPAAYSASMANYASLTAYLEAAGITDPDDVDLCTALSAGVVAQQMANDPTGDRWRRRIEDVVDMFLRHVAARRRRTAPPKKGTP